LLLDADSPETVAFYRFARGYRQVAGWTRDLEDEGMSTRAADDFEFIRSRIEQLKRERQPAPVPPTSPPPPANQSDERVWNWDGFCPGFVCRM